MKTVESKEFQEKALQRRISSEYRRIFADHGLEYKGLWQVEEYSDPALAILKTGIFSGEELVTQKGRKYQVNRPDLPDALDSLLFGLVRAYLDYFSGTDVLFSFDQYFWEMAEIAQLGGVQRRRLDNLWKEWRKKISERLDAGKISLKLWQQTMWKSEPPEPFANDLSKILLRYLPTADATTIAWWTNKVLEALGQEPVNENTHRLYVGRLKKAMKKQSQGPIAITE